jgi:pimeloyl-ACP methyl ester carboxylesterase
MIIRLLMLTALSFPPSARAAEPDPYAQGREVVTSLGKIFTPNGVNETFEIELGEARQVVNVRGADRANPILLFVHGGPGAVEMPIAWSFQRPWEDFFTVVQWDQRGAGRSYPLNDPKKLAPTMTIERYRDDAIELIEALKARYGKRKVILVGHSWGSIVGLSVAVARPDLLHAYVGMGQAIGFLKAERVGIDWTLAEAKRRGDTDAARELTALAPYPEGGPFTIAKADGWRKWAIRYGALAAYRPDAQFYFDVIKLSPEYTPADRKAWSQGSAFSVETLWPKLRDVSFANVRQIKVPIFFFLGRHDYLVPHPVASAWIDQVRAPRKETIWFDHSAHLMMIEEPGRTLQALVDRVRPVAQEKGR